MTEPTNAEIRAWARAQGMGVSDRGRLPAHVVSAYAGAHPPASDAPATGPPAPAVAGPGSAPDPVWSAPAELTPPPFTPPMDAPSWYGQPGGQRQSSAPHAGGTDGFAIASLVLGLIGGVLLALIFGVLALRRIRKTGRDGRGLAIAGLVLAGLWTLGAGVLVAVGVPDSAERAVDGSVTTSGDVTLADVQVGDCTERPPEGEVLTLRVLPCASQHASEVYAVFDLDGEQYPGDDDAVRFAEGGCNRELERLLPESDETAYGLFYYAPSEDSWSLGDRSVICLLEGPNGRQMTGSVVERSRRL
jgi:hypothetical protein